jgi:hypothetical protein
MPRKSNDTKVDRSISLYNNYKKKKYLAYLKRVHDKLPPSNNFFNAALLHDSIRTILGEELSKQFIREAHKYKEPKERQNASWTGE